MHMFTAASEQMAFEPKYNLSGQRIFPTPGVPEGDWGGAWCLVAPGTTTTPHAHDEKEMFFILQGTGTLRLEDTYHRVGHGDTFFIPPTTDHALTCDDDQSLLFLTIWWDTDVPTSEQSA